MKKLIVFSQNIYGLLLSFYPKSYRREFGREMKYVYSESIKEAVDEEGILGIIIFWFKSGVDAVISLFREHLDNLKKGGGNMRTKNKDIIMDNKVFGILALVTVGLLLIPAFLMAFQIPLVDPGSGYEVLNWNWFDFAIMGVMIFGTGSAFIVGARIFPAKYRALLVAGAVLGFLALWAQLAVGAVSQVIDFLI